MSHARHFVRSRGHDSGSSSRRYGVLVGSVREGRLEGGRSPHFSIWVAGWGNFRVAVNVQSQDGSEVVALFDPNYSSPSPALDLAGLAGGSRGFQPLKTGPGGNGLDYLRDNLFDVSAMQPAPDVGGDASLDTLLETQVMRAQADAGAVAIVFGQSFDDGGQSRDELFGFSPARGVHDIHMNQGNSGSFERDNTTHGDGALFFVFSNADMAALFVRFATQGTETNDRGDPTDVDQ